MNLIKNILFAIGLAIAAFITVIGTAALTLLPFIVTFTLMTIFIDWSGTLLYSKNIISFDVDTTTAIAFTGIIFLLRAITFGFRNK